MELKLVKAFLMSMPQNPSREKKHFSNFSGLRHIFATEKCLRHKWRGVTCRGTQNLETAFF